MFLEKAMVNLRKKIIVGVFFLIMQDVCAMEQQGQHGALDQYISPETLGSFSSVASNGWSLVATGFAKATTTAINAYSDDAAFAKLGFPPTNDVNKAELLKFKAVSDRHSQAILAHANIADERFTIDDQFLNRRFEFLKRAINAIPGRVDGVELAGFCLEHYSPVMNSFMVSRLVTFVQSKKESSEQVAQKLSYLAESADSSILRSILEGSGIKRNSVEQDQYVEEKLVEEEQKENKEEKNQDQQ